ncbi:uncharacterized protein LOC128405217 [Podarcis raffonei]|uniref:uncharacterized protein LOC128405217 n=1 Tax=Podarcis raffonei TaxID=65483 RepID=UPI00232905E1|nr:uncharacterized protein LOC128405217 [Podarcis raffonei]XP_053227599.1 uncharacterized protein LOC128405217 [Podarcis raffonei]
MLCLRKVSKGLGQLEAYIDAEEGVAFQMDNNLIWDSLDGQYTWAIQGLTEKLASSKFWVTCLPMGKVMLRNWAGKYLAAVAIGENPVNFPIQPVQYSEDPSLQFEVFYKGNRVAFQAYNGLFLTRTYRGFTSVEAAKLVADDSCYFRPLIGDLLPPKFKILRVITSDLSHMIYHHSVLDKQVYANRGEAAVRHTFDMTWETTVADTVFWNSLWGLGVETSCHFTLEDAMPRLEYTENNDRTVLVQRNISQRLTQEVLVPPHTEVLAKLVVHRNSTATVSFTAVIQKVKSNGDVVMLNKGGLWKGLVYHGVRLEITKRKLSERRPLEECPLL